MTAQIDLKTAIQNALNQYEGAYDPEKIEQGLYAFWEESGYFKPDYHKHPAFSIALPPPNVTGSLHMGHGFNNTVMDALIRYHRMRGFNTLWQAGTDHAGIATQMVVERQLNAQGITRHDLGREPFLEKVWQWKAESGGRITDQIRRLGSSVDWSRERFTMDEGLSNAVKEVFVRLYDEGLIYRGKRLVNWDPKLQTALSDLEVESHESKGHLWHFRYYFADADTQTQDGKNYLVVATTRPETLLGDTAVAVNPKDERYQHLIGKRVRLPITDRLIPIVADDYVESDFGTGCVKITPAHDFNDYKLGERHNLPLINIFNASAEILPQLQVFADIQTREPKLETTPQDYANLDRFLARKKLVEQAENEGWLDKIEDYALKIPKGDRSGVVVEPWLTDQWYVAMAELAKPAILAVEDGRTQFVPAQYKNMYMAWMKDLQDWCISRQLWWGHRIPAWYDAAGNIYVGRDEAEVRQKYALAPDYPIRQDEDVLDTWFSSALWTFSTLGWADPDDDGQALAVFHPTSVLVTGFDIIFFWVARMMMLTMHFIKDKDGNPQVPFKTVYVHGLVRDGNGQKMSKSKGNVLDPIDLIDGIDLPELIKKRTTGLMNPKDVPKIEKATIKEFPNGIPAFGTDALRFTFASLANTGRDINFDLKRIEGYRNFCNKIYNATRFVLMNCLDKDGNAQAIDQAPRPELWNLPEKWIISRLATTTAEIHKHFEQYRLDLVSQDIYEFIWNQYCDWYVELAKASLNDPNTSSDQKAQIRYVLLFVLERALRLTHPIMPYLTEKIWQTLAPLVGQKTTPSLTIAAYPTADLAQQNPQAEADMAWLQDLITAVRNIRGEMKLGNAVRLPLILQNLTPDESERLQRIETQFKTLAKIDTIDRLASSDTPPPCAQSMIGETKILVPIKGLIDPVAEISRLTKQQEKLQKQADALANKLANQAFIDKAPKNLIEQEQNKLTELNNQLAEIDKQKQTLQTL